MRGQRKPRVRTITVDEILADFRKMPGDDRLWYAKAAALAYTEYLAERCNLTIKNIDDFLHDWMPYATMVSYDPPGLHIHDAERCAEIACGAMFELGRAQEEIRRLRALLATHSATRDLPDADFPAKDGGNHRSTSAMNTSESLPDEGNSGVVSRGGGGTGEPDGALG